MIIQDHEVTINDETFVIQPFPAFKGLVNLKRLVKIVGPSMTSLFNLEAEVTEENIETANISQAVSLLVENFEDNDVENLIRDLVKSVSKNGTPLNFDTEFMADYGKLIKLVVEVVKANYSSVFQLGGFLQE
tara:strand:- start:9684 stop:10079 length:396 start_codon:yes stop_codon:yes gene_type:complete